MSEAIRSRLIRRTRMLRSEAAAGLTGLDFTTPEHGPLVNDLESYPHAFVIGCVMDRQIKAERAWEIPERMRGRIGSFEFKDLAALSRP